MSRERSYLNPQVSDRLLRRIPTVHLESKPISSALEGLSLRESRLVAEGKIGNEIAVMLDLDLQTVGAIARELAVNNVALAIPANFDHARCEVRWTEGLNNRG